MTLLELRENTMMDQMTRIEWKLDQVLAALAVRNVDAIVEAPAEQAAADPPERSEGQDQGDDGRVDLLARLTTKQHATFQMLLGGASNKDIAARFGVTENTAKVYVRSIAAKVKVKTRSEIVMRLWSAFRNVDDESYRMMSGGLPKEWNQKFEYPDQFADLYRKDTDGPETDA